MPHDDLADGEEIGLIADGVRFPEHLLEQKVEGPPHWFVISQMGKKLIEMAPQARQFFRDIAPVRKENNFLEQSLIGSLDFQSRLGHPFQQRAAMMIHYLRSQHANRLHAFLQRQRATAKISRQRLAFTLPHLDKLLQALLAGPSAGRSTQLPHRFPLFPNQECPARAEPDPA